MKLLLASNGAFLTDQGYNLLGIPKDQIKIAWVTTASKGSSNLEYLERHKEAMQEKGYDFEEIDIEGKGEKELRETFKGKNVIHMEGGNTFYLLKAVRASGFEKILHELLKQGLVYVGTSAGAYIACPTIIMATWGKQRDRYDVTDFQALNLVPFVMRVHYTDNMEEALQEHVKNSPHPVRILRDGQGLLVEDGKYTFYGTGEEVKL